jgi:O-antigen/teichoic acid export membrane protein
MDFESLGYYSFSVKIYTILKNLLSIFIIATQPKVLYFFKKTPEKSLNFSFSTLSFLFLVFSAFLPFLFLKSEDLFVFFGGFDYLNESMPSFFLLTISLFFSIIGWALNSLIQICYNRESVILKTTIFASIFNALGNFLLIPLYGIIAAALTTAISELIILIFAYIDVKKLVSKNFLSSKMIFLILLNVFIFTLINLIPNLNFILIAFLNLSIFILFNFFFLFFIDTNTYNNLKRILFE